MPCMDLASPTLGSCQGITRQAGEDAARGIDEPAMATALPDHGRAPRSHFHTPRVRHSREGGSPY